MIQCVGAPVRNSEGNVCAAISVSGLARQYDVDQLLGLAELVTKVAHNLSVKIGGK